MELAFDDNKCSIINSISQQLGNKLKLEMDENNNNNNQQSIEQSNEMNR